MSTIENRKKIAVIGKGTGGCLTTSILLRNPNIDIDWYFDPNTPAQSVGEGTFPFFPGHLQEDWGMSYETLSDLDYSIKKGIRKINWSGKGDFVHTFDLGQVGIHFNASKYQSLITKWAPNKGVNLIPQPLTDLQNTSYDHIVDCSGSPKNLNDYVKCDSIPVNSVYINQCYWEKPEFDYTLTMARPYGWVFGIPLQNRCSIGYLFNKNINNLEEIKEDINHVFKEFNLIPSNNTKHFSFNNYYKKTNFTNKISYNGNSSFFLEPLEATSLTLVQHNAYLINNIINNQVTPKECNESFIEFIKEIEGMIMLHYLAGSKFKTPFWEFAQYKANLSIIENSKNPKFKDIILNSLKFKESPFDTKILDRNNLLYGAWNPYSYYQNLTSLNLYNKLLLYFK
jgi:hypothetical protein